MKERKKTTFSLMGYKICMEIKKIKRIVILL